MNKIDCAFSLNIDRNVGIGKTSSWEREAETLREVVLLEHCVDNTLPLTVV